MGTSGSLRCQHRGEHRVAGASVMTTAMPTGLPLRRYRTNEATDDAEGRS